MNYELAKQLREAGFPQEIVNAKSRYYYKNEKNSIGNDVIVFIQDDKIDSSWVKAPTLAELVESCGSEFGSLSASGGFEKFTPLNTDWVCWRRNKQESYGGENPEEAVAKLWLELNKEKKR